MPSPSIIPDRKSDPVSAAADHEAIDWLIRLQDAPDDGDVRQAFEGWYNQPQHAQAWATLQRTDDLLHAVEARRRTVRRAIGSGVAGAAALCAALVLVPDAALHWRADAVTGTGETRAVALPDGSSVRLAPGSAIAFDDRGIERRVRLLRGTAWFDVVHDPRRPFRVATGGITTTVLGTAFEVRRGTATAADVSVRRGAVRVACDERPRAARQVAAGQSLDLACGDHAALAGISPDRIAAWTDGQFIADDTSLRSVIDALRPWYHGMIVARGERLDRIHVTGVYDLRDPAMALAALAATGRVRTHRITPWIMVISAN